MGHDVFLSMLIIAILFMHYNFIHLIFMFFVVFGCIYFVPGVLISGENMWHNYY